ncbi:MAG TPA: S24/S26 family peptidase [Pseudobacteroides sp.]|uniref:S24/S26 family peptidase n=1 Tax=Pseudobacteroides sp. TaxID=1968840 RepID=UPI002F91D969
MPVNNNKIDMIAILKARKNLNRGTWITTCGISMNPLIPQGSKVYINPVASGIRVGDVVVFGLEGNLLIHRVVRLYTENSSVYYQTKGDNVFYLDPVINESNIMGCVEKIHTTPSDGAIFALHNGILARVIAGISLFEGKIHRLSCSEVLFIRPMLICMKYILKSLILMCSYLMKMKSERHCTRGMTNGV